MTCHSLSIDNIEAFDCLKKDFRVKWARLCGRQCQQITGKAGANLLNGFADSVGSADGRLAQPPSADSVGSADERLAQPPSADSLLRRKSPAKKGQPIRGISIRSTGRFNYPVIAPRCHPFIHEGEF